jgi:hypothetical protein
MKYPVQLIHANKKINTEEKKDSTGKVSETLAQKQNTKPIKIGVWLKWKRL